MFYRFVKMVIGRALGMFYRVQLVALPQALTGPVMFVGNHPNSMIDPAMIFAVTPRKVTFLAREPLFHVPVLGWLLRGLEALPVYRKQDHPTQMDKNSATLDTAASALVDARAITIFPEGKSHSDPELAEVKTGCARIAFKAARQNTTLRIVPVGMTYEQKHRFRSRVHVEMGQPIVVEPVGELSPDDEKEWVRQLTDRVEEGIKSVTLNLEEWADLPLIQTAEELYSLRLGEKTKDPERLRRFARGIQLFRAEQPVAFEALRENLMSFRARLEVVKADAADLGLQYRRGEVATFALRNVAALIFGFPLFAIGCVLFFIPFMVARIASRVVPLPADRVGTFKFVSALVLTPLWQTLLSYWAWRAWGPWGLTLSLLGALPLALFCRYFFERRRSALRDAMTFFTLGNRSKLKAMLLVEGERLSNEIEQVATKLKPRVISVNDESSFSA
ncbi:MAG: lysophospholipid acyltransferase family protein [Myxococcaceae bacterium]|nr:lysophospholipid acyltransferase family protein [Myxococcaceae bacterium]